MSQTETLMLLASQVEERRKVVLDDLGLGVRDHLAYVSAVGEMAGYMRIQQLISEMIQAGKTEDEAFESSPTDSVVKIDSKRGGK